jgi:hypothetical protein
LATSQRDVRDDGNIEYCFLTDVAGDPPPEHEGKDLREMGIDGALRLARIMHSDLVFAGASAWNWWLAVSVYNFPDGLLYVPPPQTQRPTTVGCPHPVPEVDAEAEVQVSKRLWAMAQFSRFVRPGSVRLAMRSDDGAGDGDGWSSPPGLQDGVLVSAWLRPAGSPGDSDTLVMVYINLGDADCWRTLSVSGDNGTWPWEGATCWATTCEWDCACVSSQLKGPPRTLVLPSRSVVTVLLPQNTPL